MVKDNKKAIQLLKTARGQMDGVLNMIDEDRYCVDVSNQLLAIQSLIKKANEEILTAHMKNCVKNAIENGEADDKIDEIISLMQKMIK